VREYAVVGGGIGGSSAAALLNAREKDVVLLEKEPTLGGCAATFSHCANRYNAGATTLAGYHEGGIVRRLFDEVGVAPDVVLTDPGIVVIQGKQQIKRYQKVDRFVDELQQVHPHPKHSEFWNLIDTLSKSFYDLEGHYYSNASFSKKAVSLLSFFPMFKQFWPYLWKDSRRFIQHFYGGISSEYLDFLDAQIMIVAQCKSDKLNFFTAALALGYTFNETHYAMGGMGKLCETLTSCISDVRTDCPVNFIRHEKDRFILSTPTDVIETKNLIMGTTHYDSAKWFNEKSIKTYYQKYESLNNRQSAFVLYLTIKIDRAFSHHYQLIAKEIIPMTLSKALFVSFSDVNDHTIAPKGYYSVTASIHTNERWWIGLSPSNYHASKKELSQLLKGWICDTLCIETEAIVHSFAATPKTFGRYINRTQLGGNALSMTNSIFKLPSNDTPIKGLYHVGDTSYAAQGWPGVVMGTMNLIRLIHE